MVIKKLTASIGVATILVHKFDPKNRIFTGLTPILGISNLSPKGEIKELQQKKGILINFHGLESLCILDPNSALHDNSWSMSVSCVSKYELPIFTGIAKCWQKSFLHLVLSLVPPLHVAEQTVHAVHSPTSQSTERKVNLWCFIWNCPLPGKQGVRLQVSVSSRFNSLELAHISPPSLASSSLSLK